MGGRGASSGANSRQITFERVLLMSQVADIREAASKLRTSMEGVGASSGGMPAANKKQCFCCEEFTLPVLSEYGECEVCGWIDDPYQNKHPDSLNGKNPISLNEARKRYNS